MMAKQFRFEEYAEGRVVGQFDCGKGMHLEVASIRAHIDWMTGQLFHCRTKGGGATYGLTFLAHQPEIPPKCEDCGRLFPATSDGHWLHSQLAGPVVLLAPDSSL